MARRGSAGFRLFAEAFSSVVPESSSRKRRGTDSPPPQLAPAGSLTCLELPGFAFSAAFLLLPLRFFFLVCLFPERPDSLPGPKKTLHCYASTGRCLIEPVAVPRALNESPFAESLLPGLIMPASFSSPASVEPSFLSIIHYRDFRWRLHEQSSSPPGYRDAFVARGPKKRLCLFRGYVLFLVVV